MALHCSLLWESREKEFIVWSRRKIFRILEQLVFVVATVF